jgi:porin
MGVPGRPNDTFGLAFARTQVSSAFIPFLRQHLDLGLEHENAIEAYYNLAILYPRGVIIGNARAVHFF